MNNEVWPPTFHIYLAWGSVGAETPRTCLVVENDGGSWFKLLTVLKWSCEIAGPYVVMLRLLSSWISTRLCYWNKWTRGRVCLLLPLKGSQYSIGISRDNCLCKELRQIEFRTSQDWGCLWYRLPLVYCLSLSFLNLNIYLDIYIFAASASNELELYQLFLQIETLFFNNYSLSLN